MNNLITNQRRFLLLLFSCFVILVFLSLFFIILNTSGKEISSPEIKNYSDIIEKRLKNELIKPPSRFTSFFYTKNNNLFNNIDDYHYSYQIFSKDSKKLFKEFPIKFKYIEQNLNEKKQLPAFVDNVSGYLFYPVAYLNLNNINEINEKSDELFFTKENTGVNERIVEKGKLLNYILVNVNNNTFVILLSPPYDPDPLYPNNSRKALIVTVQKEKNLPYRYHLKNFIISNNR